jgi:hypothetical protein
LPPITEDSAQAKKLQQRRRACQPAQPLSMHRGDGNPSEPGLKKELL